MLRLTVKFLIRSRFHESTQIHDKDPIAEVLNDSQIVGDNDVGKTEFLLQVNQEIDDLCPYRNIEGRDRFIPNDDFRTQSQGPLRSLCVAFVRR